MQLQVLGDLKAVSAGANTSLMKGLSSGIIAQLVFHCLNALGNNTWDSESYRQAYTAGNTQNCGAVGEAPIGVGSVWIESGLGTQGSDREVECGRLH